LLYAFCTASFDCAINGPIIILVNMSQFDRPPLTAPTAAQWASRQVHDHNPVHLCGCIQGHGWLLALTLEDWRIVRSSQNLAAVLGQPIETILGQPLTLLLSAAQITSLQTQLRAAPDRLIHQCLTLDLPDCPITADCLIHQTDREVIFELEPSELPQADHLMAQHDQLNQAIAHLRSIPDLTTFLHESAVAVSQMIGFDHVMVYRFDAQQAGQVIAEVTAPGVPSYLGLHFPEADIPRSVRALYQRGLQRFSPNIHAPMLAIVDAGDLPPLDLSRSGLRGVDPCCISYYRNIDVSAFFVIALIKDHQLWGLITCQHTTPKPLSYSLRSHCHLLGQFIGVELSHKVSQDEILYVNQLSHTLSEFVASISQAENFKQALVEPQPRLGQLVGAQGAAVCLDGDITLVGATPTIDQVEALLQWSDSATQTNLFHTAHLAAHYPPAQGFKAVASGLLLLKISQVRRYAILWFRPEVAQTITWAGNPADHFAENADGSLSMCPRASFAAWQEIVEATALPWQQAELDNALDLRNAIIGIVLNRADELAQINLELERSNQELASFAYAASHDLKEPLRGIHNFSNLLLRRYGDVLDATGVHRLQTVVRLAQRMDLLVDTLLQFARLGQAELTLEPTDLNAVVQKVVEMLQVSRTDTNAAAAIRIDRPLPTIASDAVLISEVFANLLSNALKYNDQPQPVIEVGYYDATERSGLDLPIAVQQKPDALIFYVRDNGIGIHDRHFQNIFRLFKRLHERDAYGGGAGAGLTITKKIVERHHGWIWVESTPAAGAVFYFVLS
jgi:two-component system, chemotaxis family, sensor kinase Cph1